MAPQRSMARVASPIASLRPTMTNQASTTSSRSSSSTPTAISSTPPAGTLVAARSNFTSLVSRKQVGPATESPGRQKNSRREDRAGCLIQSSSLPSVKDLLIEPEPADKLCEPACCNSFFGGEMMKPFSRAVGCLSALLLSLVLATPHDVLAQNHVVSPLELQKDVAASSASRQKNVAQVESFLSSEEAQRAMKSAHINYQEIKNAVRQLSDEDLAQLSARSEKAQKDFAAGRPSPPGLVLFPPGRPPHVLDVVDVGARAEISADAAAFCHFLSGGTARP